MRKAVSVVVGHVSSTFVLTLTAMLLLSAVAVQGQGSSSASAAPVAAPVVVAPEPSCQERTPTSAQGYAALWSTLDAREWGGADVSISVPLADGRVVWLYGDTFSSGRMVHSSAIVQDGGCLAVANGGAQLLPDGPKGEVYWIEDAFQISAEVAEAEGHPEWAGGLWVAAEEHRITGDGPWDFEYTGRTRSAIVQMDDGELTFDRWGATATVPQADPGAMIVFGHGHFGYSVREHRWADLASGQVLTTVAQNFDDGVLRPPSAYAPLWFEGGEAAVRGHLS